MLHRFIKMEGAMNTNPTKKERAHQDRVKELRCSVCDAPPPSSCHHIDQSCAWAVVALCHECHQGRGGIHQLGVSLVKRTFSSSSLPLASEFNPSDALAQFLVDDGVENHLTPAEAKNRLKRFVRSFVGTIADSLEDRQIPRAQLTENGEFRENVARALLHRFPVRVYRQGDFLTALLKEITPVAMSGQFRTVSGVLTRANGELVVELTGHKAPPLLPDAPWVKATTPGN